MPSFFPLFYVDPPHRPSAVELFMVSGVKKRRSALLISCALVFQLPTSHMRDRVQTAGTNCILLS